MILSKFDKKVFMFLSMAAAIILVLGILVYLILDDNNLNVQNIVGGAQIESK
jgi:hypothetical protein